MSRYLATNSAAFTLCVKKEWDLLLWPHYLGEGLHKIIDLPQTCWGNMWILTHPELSKVARIKTFMSWMSENVG